VAKVRNERPDLVAALVAKKDLTDEIKEGLHGQLTAYGRGAI
jgi:hypothetical protein